MPSESPDEAEEQLTAGCASASEEEGGAAPPSLDSLPRTVLTSILQHVQQASNPGALIQLALVSSSLRDAVFSAEGLWEQHCIRQGYASPRPSDTRPGLPVGEEDERWREYYSKRMMARWCVRRFLKLLLPFMRREAQTSFLPGASPVEISEAEQRLGVSFPWELWELYRYRAGQAPGPAVALVDDVRLLGLHELGVEEQHLPLTSALTAGTEGGPTSGPELPPPRPPSLPAHPGRPPGPRVPTQPAHPQLCGGEEGPAGSQGPGAVRMIRFGSNVTSSRRYLVSSTGQVFIARGLMVTAMAASSISMLFQRLLS